MRAARYPGAPGRGRYREHWQLSLEAIGSADPAVDAEVIQFYAELLQRLGLVADEFPQWDRARWPELKQRFATVFATRPRAEWCELLEGTEACFAPVLSTAEAVTHPHNVVRGTFVEVNGVTLPGPAPRFARTPAEVGTPCHPGTHTAAAREGTLWH